MKKLLTLLPLLFIFVSCEKKSTQIDDCIDPNAINPDALCYAVYDPVCGCDGVTYGNDCEAAVSGVKSFTKGACGCEYLYKGVVKDYSEVNGCSTVIVLDDGDVLEPVKLPDGVHLKEGSTVELNYRAVTAHESTCMDGIMGDVFCIRQTACLAIAEPAYNYPPMTDEVYIKSAEIEGDCLRIDFSYGGGCEAHEFELRPLVFFCATPPVPPTTLQFVHNANGDRCEALLSKSLSYDLSGLQIPGQSSMPIVLGDYHGKYNATLTYNY